MDDCIEIEDDRDISESETFPTPEEENTFKILVATDIHLGYKEKDPIRGDDTFNSFEEILRIGVREKVDFILLGGDLFHDTKPTPYCIYKCTELLRKYCLGDKPVKIEFLSDQAMNFHHTYNKIVNYEDPNLNVSIPVFSIHGNHDDPTGQRQISALDLMATTGLVNYFGRWDCLEKVEIDPILLKKGDSLLALYGLSHIADGRLGRLFLDKKVNWLSPDEKIDGKFFNLLVLHQNRVARGNKNFIPAEALAEFLDLVIWGHEHECKITPEVQSNGIPISQPGSSVATSLAAGESITKKVGILKIRNDEYKMNEVELRTVRPFIFSDLNVDLIEAGIHTKPAEKTMQEVEDYIEHMIHKAGDLDRLPNGILPLLRLRIHYKNEKQVFNAIKFGQKFIGRVANPDDIVTFVGSKSGSSKRSKNDTVIDEDDLANSREWANRVEDLILKCLEGANSLNILSAKGLNQGVIKYIDADDSDAPICLIEHQLKKTFDEIKRIAPMEKDVAQCLEELRLARQDDADIIEAQQVLSNPSRPRTTRKTSAEIDENDEIVVINDDDVPNTSIRTTTNGSSRTAKTKGPGSRGGKGSRGPRGGRGKAKV